jgi:hypothetical protein
MTTQAQNTEINLIRAATAKPPMDRLTFTQVIALAEQGATIGSCTEIELAGEFRGYPEDDVSPEYSGSLCPLPGVRAARKVYEPTGEEVWLPVNF